MRRLIVALCFVVLCASAPNAYVYNFAPGPFPYPYPNTLDDYPNTAYCGYQQYSQPAVQYSSFKVEGVIVPYIQPDGKVVYMWSYNKMTSLGNGIQKVKSTSIPRPTLREVTNTPNYSTPIIPPRRYNWGKPF